jgi:histidine triad (HIT) family protein
VIQAHVLAKGRRALICYGLDHLTHGGSLAGILERAGERPYRPPRRRPGIDHVIVIPRRHVRSLLELPAEDAGPVIAMVQEVARLLAGLHGGCQVITNIGSEQHNRHLHVHVVVSTGQDRLGGPF